MNKGLSEGVNVDKFGHGALNGCPNKCKMPVIRAIIGHKFEEVTLTVKTKGKCMSSEQ